MGKTVWFGELQVVWKRNSWNEETSDMPKLGQSDDEQKEDDKVSDQSSGTAKPDDQNIWERLSGYSDEGATFIDSFPVLQASTFELKFHAVSVPLQTTLGAVITVAFVITNLTNTFQSVQYFCKRSQPLQWMIGGVSTDNLSLHPGDSAEVELKMASSTLGIMHLPKIELKTDTGYCREESLGTIFVAPVARI